MRLGEKLAESQKRLIEADHRLSMLTTLLSQIEDELAGTYDSLVENNPTNSNEQRVRMASLSIGHAYGLAKFGASL